MYSAIETNYESRIMEGLKSASPNVSALLPDAQAMLAKFDEAVSIVEQGAPLNRFYDDVARLRIVRAHLREVNPELKAGNIAKARESFGAFNDNWDSIDSDEKRETIRRMTHTTARLRSLADDVLDVTRIDTGDLRYEIAAFDADALAAGVVTDIAGADAARVVVEPSMSGSAMAWGDEQRAWQVLANLLSNALKFSPAGTPVHLRVLDDDAGEVHFAVGDRGPGVAPEQLARIFEKFSRADGVVQGEGTGLGLYIARSLAYGQGGRIQVESEVGKGSTFTFVLPKAGGDVRPVAAVSGEHAPPGEAEPQHVDEPRPEKPGGAQRGHRRRSVARSGARRWRRP